jgi:hypothetical protein
MKLTVGTRSILWGGHQFILHPIFVALAWRKLYGSWPRKLPIWFAFFLHDIGYWGKNEMDGEEGENHPEWGAAILSDLFDYGAWSNGDEWYIFSATHSRSYASKIDRWDCSDLMRADKLATAMMPQWLYVALLWLSNEWVEYRDRWVAAGTYPGKPDDGIWAWSTHLQANWSRFNDVNAVAGKAFGGE